MPSGKTSLGVLARKESSELVLLLSVCVRPTDLRRGSGTGVRNICRGTRPGSSANTARQERRNTISPTCPPRPTCALWLPSSRHDGFANRFGRDVGRGALVLDQLADAIGVVGLI